MYSTVYCYLKYMCPNSNEKLTTCYVSLLILNIIPRLSQDPAMRSREFLESFSRVSRETLETLSRLFRDISSVSRESLEKLSKNSQDYLEPVTRRSRDDFEIFF
jgi:hypothetical protein